MAMIAALVASLGSVALAHPEEDTLAAKFSSDVTTGAAPLTVHFTDRSTGSVESWHWDFGDDSFSTRQDPTHTFQTPGTYNVTLIVSDEFHSSSTTSQITVTPAPAATPQPIRVVPVPVYPIDPDDRPAKPIDKQPGKGKKPDYVKKPDPVKKPDMGKKPDKGKRGGEKGNADNPVRHF